jgi:hypothetical protein
MVSEAHRKKFESFLLSEINGDEKQEFNFSTVRAKNLKIVFGKEKTRMLTTSGLK